MTRIGLRPADWVKSRTRSLTCLPLRQSSLKLGTAAHSLAASRRVRVRRLRAGSINRCVKPQTNLLGTEPSGNSGIPCAAGSRVTPPEHTHENHERSNHCRGHLEDRHTQYLVLVRKFQIRESPRSGPCSRKPSHGVEADINQGVGHLGAKHLRSGLCRRGERGRRVAVAPVEALQGDEPVEAGVCVGGQGAEQGHQPYGDPGPTRCAPHASAWYEHSPPCSDMTVVRGEQHKSSRCVRSQPTTFVMIGSRHARRLMPRALACDLGAGQTPPDPSRRCDPAPAPRPPAARRSDRNAPRSPAASPSPPPRARPRHPAARPRASATCRGRGPP
jgi:hypothetical protein